MASDGRLALCLGLVHISIFFLEDASINIFDRVGARPWPSLGMALAAIQLVQVLATLWTIWQKINELVAPEPTSVLDGCRCVAVDLSGAYLLAR
jgi:hypothetical protein